MANNFRIYASNNIGTTSVVIGGHTCNTGIQETVIGMNISNIHTAAISVDVKYVSNTGVNYFIVKDAPIPVGSALVPVGGDQKLVLIGGDQIQVSSNTAASVHALMSLLERS